MFKTLKGMQDFLPEEMGFWKEMETKIHRIVSIYGYQEIRTPLLEETELFARSIGASTDVVEMEMFSFEDQGGTSMTLRPEATASVIRAYLEHHMGHGNPLVKVYCMGPMFRHERPQKGRFRQFHQINLEAIGLSDPWVDVEVIEVLMKICEGLGIPEPKLFLNSVGDRKCRPSYREKLVTYLRSKKDNLCQNCIRRTETNPLRVFDCKVESCQAALTKAPLIIDDLCSECLKHFEQVKAGLTELGIHFDIHPRLVRGLNYYTRTAFEVTGSGLGSQNAVGGGGRYDGLAQELGGEETPAIGFAMGLERLRLIAKNLNPSLPLNILFLPLESNTVLIAQKLSQELRKQVFAQDLQKISVDLYTGSQSVKSALRYANKKDSHYTVLLGSEEEKRKIASIKDLRDGKQHEVPFSELTSWFFKHVKS